MYKHAAALLEYNVLTKAAYTHAIAHLYTDTAALLEYSKEAAVLVGSC